MKIELRCLKYIDTQICQVNDRSRCSMTLASMMSQIKGANKKVTMRNLATEMSRDTEENSATMIQM